MVLSRNGIRRILQNVLVDDADLNAFCVDHFPEVADRFTDGMNRVAKLNTLIERVDASEIYQKLHAFSPERLATIQSYHIASGNQTSGRHSFYTRKLDEIKTLICGAFIFDCIRRLLTWLAENIDRIWQKVLPNAAVTAIGVSTVIAVATLISSKNTQTAQQSVVNPGNQETGAKSNSYIETPSMSQFDVPATLSRQGDSSSTTSKPIRKLDKTTVHAESSLAIEDARPNESLLPSVVVGKLFDSRLHKPLVHARVQVMDPKTEFERSVTTDIHGVFTIDELPPNSSFCPKIRIHSDGYEYPTSSRRCIQLKSGARHYLEFRLDPTMLGITEPGMIYINNDLHRESEESDILYTGYWLAQNETDQAQYLSVMKNNPSEINESNLPVTNVSWRDIAMFCNRLSEISGYEKCYEITKESITLVKMWVCNGYRIPSEDEWVFAAFNYDKLATLRFDRPDRHTMELIRKNRAWFSENSASSPHPVGTSAGERAGFHDLIGNVAEWVWLVKIPGKDRAWVGNRSYPVHGATLRLDYWMPVRGGSWVDSLKGQPLANQHSASYTDNDVGFRIARSRIVNIHNLESK